MKAAHRLAAACAAVLAALAAALGAAPAQAQVDPYYPYVEEDLAFTDVAPGDSLDVNPRFRQEAPLPADTAALAVSFSGPGRDGLMIDGAEAVAGYDNCKRGLLDDPVGVACVFTDLTDLPGQVFTFTGPVTYTVDAEAPGPLGVCACGWGMSAVTAETLAVEYHFVNGEPWWDPDSTNLLGITPADGWDGPPSGDPYPQYGSIAIETSDHPYDLAVEGAAFAGAEGDTVSAVVEATNLGPADAIFQHPSPGSYTLRGRLPGGAELVSLEPQWQWECAEDVPAGYDFACTTGSIGVGETLGLGLEVRITDAADTSDGLVEIDAVRDGGVPLLDADLANNTAALTLDADAPAGPAAKLPETGAPLSGWIAAAGAVLAAGAALLIVARRRSPA